MKGVQCYELFGGIALKNHAFSFHFIEENVLKINGDAFLLPHTRLLGININDAAFLPTREHNDRHLAILRLPVKLFVRQVDLRKKRSSTSPHIGQNTILPILPMVGLNLEHSNNSLLWVAPSHQIKKSTTKLIKRSPKANSAFGRL